MTLCFTQLFHDIFCYIWSDYSCKFFRFCFSYILKYVVACIVELGALTIPLTNEPKNLSIVCDLLLLFCELLLLFDMIDPFIDFIESDSEITLILFINMEPELMTGGPFS